VGRPHDRAEWQLAECRPRQLAPFVDSIWHFAGRLPTLRERHLPNGLLEIVLQFDERFHFVSGPTRERCPRICIAGLQTGPTVIESPSRTVSVLGIRIHPLAAYAMFDMPLHESTGRLVDVSDVGGGRLVELADQCASLADPEDRVRRAAEWFASRIASVHDLDRRVAWSVAQIERSHGTVAIARIHDETGLSRAGLARAFRDLMGVAPKTYARIVRFRRAVALLHEGRTPADVALEAGYYDQPHLCLDFRELAGLTPGEFLATSRYSPTSLAQ
jgi:AraC-like DNA-binding protein